MPVRQDHAEPRKTDAPDWRRNIALFFAGQTISLLGSSIVQYAIIWHITLTTESGLMLTAATLSGFIPQLLITPFGGVWADRYPRKMMIIGADAAVAFSTLVLAIQLLAGAEVWAMVFFVLAVRAVGTGIQMPAVQAAIPQIVPADQLVRMGGINGSLRSFIRFAAPVAGGLLLKFFPLVAALFVDLFTAAIGIGMLLFVPIPMHQRKGETGRHAFADMAAGLNFILGSRFYSRFFLFLATLFLTIVPVSVLSPLLVTRFYGPEVWKFSIAQAANAAGMITGGLCLARFGRSGLLRPTIRTMSVAGIISGLSIALLGTTAPYPIFVFILGLTGFFGPFMSAPAIAYLQAHVEHGMQGRVFSFQQMLGTAMLAAGTLVFGPLADRMDVRWLLWAAGLGQLFTSVLALGSPALKDGEQKNGAG